MKIPRPISILCKAPSRLQKKTHRLHSRSGMTIVEVSIAITIFIIAAIGFTGTQSMMNRTATQLRCDAISNAILRAKVAKVLSVPWIPLSVPPDCVVSSGEVDVVADPNDPYDAGSSVTLITESAAQGATVAGSNVLITGTLRRTTTQFETDARTVLINYRLTYSYRGKTYQNFATTIRASDK